MAKGVKIKTEKQTRDAPGKAKITVTICTCRFKLSHDCPRLLIPLTFSTIPASLSARSPIHAVPFFNNAPSSTLPLLQHCPFFNNATSASKGSDYASQCPESRTAKLLLHSGRKQNAGSRRRSRSKWIINIISINDKGNMVPQSRLYMSISNQSRRSPSLLYFLALDLDFRPTSSSSSQQRHVTSKELLRTERGTQGRERIRALHRIHQR